MFGVLNEAGEKELVCCAHGGNLMVDMEVLGEECGACGVPRAVLAQRSWTAWLGTG